MYVNDSVMHFRSFIRKCNINTLVTVTVTVTTVPHTFLQFVHYVQKKETWMFLFVISSTQLGRFCWNLLHRFLSKYTAAKWCKRFPPHLNNVSTLPCETWNAHCARATVELLQKETPEFIPPQLCPSNSPDLNPVDNSMWEILQETVYETRNTNLEAGAINDATDKWLPQ